MLMSTDRISYQTEIPEQYRHDTVELYDEAFGQKLSVAVRNEQERKKLFYKGLILKYAIGAVSQKRLVGIAGFQTPEGSLTGGIRYRDLLSQLGFIKGNWAAVIFSLYERKPGPGQLLMDGIVVHHAYHGRGIGSHLLRKIADYARQNGFRTVRLDVIDTNVDAKRLYERQGFTPVRTERFPHLRWLLGFGSSTTMELRVYD